MNAEELNQARQNFLDNLEQHKEILELKREAISLLENPFVQRFLELQEYIKVDTSTEKQLIEQAFRDIAFKTYDSNQIMVFVGTYASDNSLISENAMDAEYNKYLDLETQELYKVCTNKVKDFEKDYLVVYIPNLSLNPRKYMENYFKLKEYFFGELMNNPQNIVIKKLQKKDTIDKLFK